MAYTNHDIESRAAAMLSARACAVDDRLLKSACTAACTELEARLHGNVKGSDIGELFVTAAGILAVSVYLELYPGISEEPESFSAGSLRVSLREQSVPDAATLRKRAETMLAKYLDAGGFSFKGVEG